MYECMYVVNSSITREPLDVEKGNEHSKVCDCLDCRVGELNFFQVKGNRLGAVNVVFSPSIKYVKMNSAAKRWPLLFFDFDF